VYPRWAPRRGLLILNEAAVTVTCIWWCREGPKKAFSPKKEGGTNHNPELGGAFDQLAAHFASEQPCRDTLPLITVSHNSIACAAMVAAQAQTAIAEHHHKTAFADLSEDTGEKAASQACMLACTPLSRGFAAYSLLHCLNSWSNLSAVMHAKTHNVFCR